MSTRLANMDDAKEISELVRSLSHFYLKNKEEPIPNWFSDTTTVEAIAARLLSTNYLSFVYVIGEKVVGYISIKDDSHLFHLFVSTEHQGNGISRTLWNTAKLATNASKYTLRSSIYAIPVYQRFGFEFSGEAAEREGIQYQPMHLIAKTC